MLAKCSECGLLAVRNRSTGAVCEALEITRQKGLHRYGTQDAKTANVFCYAPSPCFPSFGPEDVGKDIAAVLNDTRICDESMDYMPGRSPQEHLQIREMREQREHNLQMLEAEHKWREQQAGRERDWREQDRTERTAEARRVEERHQADARAASLRFWLGFAGAVIVTVVGQVILRLILPSPQPPTVNVSVPANIAPAVPGP
jgi:hypothetical protein